MFKFPIQHNFIIPTYDSDDYLLITKKIDNIDQLFYYLYLSCISLPDEGNVYPYYFSFRENKKYLINNDEEYFIMNVEGEFVINTKFIGNNFEVTIPGGVYKLIVYSPDVTSVIVNGNDLFENDNVITTLDELVFGRSLLNPKSKIFININDLIPHQETIHFKTKEDTTFYFYIHLDKQNFVKWYRTKKYLPEQNRIQIFNYGDYIEYPITPTISNAEIKKYAILDNNVKDIKNIIYMRYYNKFNITNHNQLLNYRSTLLDFLYNPYGDFIYAYYFENPIMFDITINPDNFKVLYNINPVTKELHCRLFISSIKNLTQLYFLRKIPGLKELNFRILTFANKLEPGFSLESQKNLNNYLNITRDINFDILVSEDDFVCTRFRGLDSIRVPLPKCSNTYCPVIQILINYKDRNYENTYLVCDLTIDYKLLLDTILTSNDDLSLWNTLSIEQKSKFLIDTFLISNQPNYISYSRRCLLPLNHYYHFNNKIVAYLETFEEEDFEIDIPYDVEEIIFFKEDDSDYKVDLTFKSNFTSHSYQVTNSSPIKESISNLGKIIYTKYIINRFDHNYEFDLLKNQRLDSYFQEYYTNNQIPSVYKINKIDNNTFEYTDSNFFRIKNPLYNELYSTLYIKNHNKNNFKIFIKKEEYHERVIRGNRYYKPVNLNNYSEIYLHGCNKINCEIERDTTTVVSNSNDKKVYLNDIQLIDYNPNNDITIFQNYMDEFDLVCIKRNELYIDIKIDKKYKDIFSKIKCVYENQIMDIIEFYKIVDKYNTFNLNLVYDSNYFVIPLRGNINQVVTISSVSKDTNVIICNHPFKVMCDESKLFNIEFEPVYYKHPYLFIGKLTQDLVFDVRDNNDLDLYIAVYKNIADLKFTYQYNLKYEKPSPPKPSIIKSSKYKKISNILNTLYDTTSILQNLGYILDRI